MQGRPGSVLPCGGFSADRGGVPGLWLKRVEGGQGEQGREGGEGGQGKVVTTLVPASGSVSQLLRAAVGEVRGDPRLAQIRAANPAPPSAE
jgi:hypothetical protein